MGFTDSAIFSRAFKNFYGISPRAYRQEYSTNCKEPFVLSQYNKDKANKEWKKDQKPLDCKMRIETLEKKQMVYVRHTGTYDTLEKAYPQLIETLFQNAEGQQLLREGKNWVLAIYHDNPEFGEETQFRTSICLTVPKECRIREDGVLGQMILEGGLYAVGHFEMTQDQYSNAWDYMYKEWLAGSDYMPRNADPFEVYRNISVEDEKQRHSVDIYVPIEPIR